MTAAIDLRLGAWQDVLADVECDALITDPPYSERTHAGQVCGSSDGNERSELGYAALDREQVEETVASWHPRTRGWIAVFSDHTLQPLWEAALKSTGRYVFTPLPVIDVGSTVRMTGDGPSSWTTFLTVARPKALSRWGTLPGCYMRSDGDPRSPHRGGKPLGVMQAIVRDYSRPGDVVCDPFAGGATTLLAAASMGRAAIGAEVDQGAHTRASARIARGYTLDMFARSVEAP